jgi:response regulator RpfG family c-di-GMP phosphodiesterase/CHASE3 domain sensor protein
MKLKSIAKIGLVIAVFFVVSALFINFDLVPNINTFTETSRSLVNDLSEQSNAINVSVNALDIASQTDEAFFINFLNEQVDYLNTYNSKLFDTLNSLELTLIEINQTSINRHSTLINTMLVEINKMIDLSTELKMTLASDTMTFDNLQLVVNDIQTSLNNIDSNVNLLNRRIIQDMTTLLNVTVVILIGIIIILLFGVFHLVNHLLPNIIKSLKVMSSSDILGDVIPNINTYYSEAETIKNEIISIIDEKKFIVELQNKLLDVYVVEDTMNVLFEFLKTRLGIDRIGLAYVDYQSKTFVAEYGVLNDKETILGPGFVQPFEKSSLSEILVHQQSVINNDIDSSLVKRPNSDALTMLNKEQIRSNLTIPIIMNQIVFGFIFFSSYKKDFFSDVEIEIGQRVANEVKTLLHRAYFTNVILTKMTSAFSEIVESKDNDTGDHILRMVKYSSIIARGLKAKNHPNYQINEKTILEVERYAAVHDIGKVGIPDAVLKKDSKLSEDEWNIMKKHPQIGGDVFKNLREALNAFDSNLYQVAEDITRYHHERWDGHGYPYGLKEHDIPLVARIVSVADVFDALASKRSYKRAFTFEESILIIKEVSNTQLDPYVVEVFLEEIEHIREVYLRFN